MIRENEMIDDLNPLWGELNETLTEMEDLYIRADEELLARDRRLAVVQMVFVAIAAACCALLAIGIFR